MRWRSSNSSGPAVTTPSRTRFTAARSSGWIRWNQASGVLPTWCSSHPTRLRHPGEKWIRSETRFQSQRPSPWPRTPTEFDFILRNEPQAFRGQPQAFPRRVSAEEPLWVHSAVELAWISTWLHGPAGRGTPRRVLLRHTERFALTPGA